MITVNSMSLQATEELERVGLKAQKVGGGYYIQGKRLAPGKMSFTHKDVTFLLDKNYHLTVAGESAESRRLQFLHHLNAAEIALFEMVQNNEVSAHYFDLVANLLGRFKKDFGGK